MHTTDEVLARERFRQSLERSQERRQVAQRRRHRLFQRRTVSIVLAGAMTLGGGAAIAAGGANKIAHRADIGSGMLRAGASGPSVSALQRALGIPADGVFGPETRRAVKRYQASKGLAVDGIVGPQTAGALGIELGISARGDQAGLTLGSTGTNATLDKIAQCESRGDPAAISPGGTYRGKYQFSRSTWRSLGGTGDPAAAPEPVQDEMAAKLLARVGGSAWPNCA